MKDFRRRTVILLTHTTIHLYGFQENDYVMNLKVVRIFAIKGLKQVEIMKDDVKKMLEEGWEVGAELYINGKFCGIFVDEDGVEFAPFGGIELKEVFEKNKEKILEKVFGIKLVSQSF